MNVDVSWYFTPKGLHNKAQGRERSERTLGNADRAVQRGILT